jgi:hypothetical protein
MSIKIINLDKQVERSINPIKPRKIPINRPKEDLNTLLDKMNLVSVIPSKENLEKENKKVLFNDIVEIAQYEKPPELVKNISPLKPNKPTVIDFLNNSINNPISKSPSPNRKKQKEITEYFKKEIETLDNKLGKRTRSPSPIRNSSPVKNFYKTNYESKKSPESKKKNIKNVKIKLDKNWFKCRDYIIYDKYSYNNYDTFKLKSQIKKIDMEDLFILKYILSYNL